MAISKGSSTGREACCFTLAVDRYDAQDMECIVYRGDREQGICCRSFIELAWQMERGFEEMDYPTPSVQMREFAVSRTAKTGEPEPKDRLVSHRRDGRLDTFRIRIRQCFHATWQGQISQDGEVREDALFEDFMEFITILDGMLTGSQSILAKGDAPLTDSLAESLRFAGRYDGIWVEAQESDEIVICGRTLEGGDKETFAVRPMFRENHTFQGSVSWMEGRQQKNFRSFLELLFLIVSATGRQVQNDDDM